MRTSFRHLAVAIAAVLSAGVVGTVGTGSASAVQVAPTVAPSPAAPGQEITVSGDPDCITGATLTVAVPALGLSQNVSGDSAWQVKFTVPAKTSAGTYPLTVTGGECSFPDAAVVVAIPESITLVKTVGTTPGVCASTTSISVTPGTTVYYCYTLTNNTQSTLSVHDLTDDKLGTILSTVSTNVAPGASTNTVTLGKTASATIDVTTTNTATWTAHTQPGIPFTATASATVTVTQATTTTTAAAAAIVVAPQFTG